MLSPLFFEAKLFTLSPKHQVVLAVHQLMDALNFAGDVELFDKLDRPTMDEEWNLPCVIVSEGGCCPGQTPYESLSSILEHWAQAHPWMHIHVYGYQLGDWILKDGHCYMKMPPLQSVHSVARYHPSELESYKLELETQLRLIDEALKHTTPTTPTVAPSINRYPNPTEVIQFFQQNPDWDRMRVLFANFIDEGSALTPYTLNKAHWLQIEEDFGIYNGFVRWFTETFDKPIEAYFLCTDYFIEHWNECKRAIEFAYKLEQKIQAQVISFNDRHRQPVLSPTPLVCATNDIPVPPNIEKLKILLFSNDTTLCQQGLELLKAVGSLESILHLCIRDVLGRFRLPTPNAHLAQSLLREIHRGESIRLTQLLQKGLLSPIVIQAAELLDWETLTESDKWLIGTEVYKNVLIPPGTYWRGAYDLLTPNYDTSSHMPHMVEISKPFWCSIYPWTNLQQAQLHDTKTHSPFEPLTDISLYEAIQICNERSKQDGLAPAYTIQKTLRKKKGRVRRWPDIEWHKDADGWRLPTSAEWEYLARAYDHRDVPGTDTSTLGAWLDEQVHAVGQLTPNGFGICDAVGNIGEFCFDSATVYPNIDSPEQPVSTLIDPWANLGQEALFRGYRNIAHQEPGSRGYRSMPDITTEMSSVGFRMVCNSKNAPHPS